MGLDAEALSELGVSVADGEFLRKLSVRDKMLLMRHVVRVNRKRDVARPFAGCIDSSAVDAAGTDHIQAGDAAGHGDDQNEPKGKRPCHRIAPGTMTLTSP